jgi:hypothetical protein
MGFVYAALIFLALDVLVALFGADSRPLDLERPTRWLFPTRPETDLLDRTARHQ